MTTDLPSSVPMRREPNYVESIARLAREAALSNFLGCDNAKPDGATPQVMPAIVHDGKLVSLESLLKYRVRFRGKFSTTDSAAFVRYVNARESQLGNEQAHAFVDAGTMTAMAIFNIGTAAQAGHCDNVAELRLVRTAAFDAVRKVDAAGAFSQKGLLEWIEDWSHALVAADGGGSPSPIAKAVAALRDVEFTKKIQTGSVQGDLRASRSAMEDIEAKARGGGLPAQLRLTAEPYLGFKPAEFALRVAYHPSNGPIEHGFTLRWIRKEDQAEQFAREFEAKLVEALKLPGERILVGTFTP